MFVLADRGDLFFLVELTVFRGYLGQSFGLAGCNSIGATVVIKLFRKLIGQGSNRHEGEPDWRRPVGSCGKCRIKDKTLFHKTASHPGSFRPKRILPSLIPGGDAESRIPYRTSRWSEVRRIVT